MPAEETETSSDDTKTFLPILHDVVSYVNISELLVQIGMYPTLAKATSAVKRGDVYVNRYRVADPKVWLVMSGMTRVENPFQVHFLQPRDNEESLIA